MSKFANLRIFFILILISFLVVNTESSKTPDETQTKEPSKKEENSVENPST